MLALLLGACSERESANQSVTDEVATSSVTGEPAPVLPVAEPKEYQRVTYVCPQEKQLVLQLFTDQRTRVELEGETHVLRPVATGDGTLFLGDVINVRVVGENATASRGGVVLLANCKVRLDS